MKAVAAIAVLCLRRWKALPVGALLLGAFSAWVHIDRQVPWLLPLALTNFGFLAGLALFVPAVIAPTAAGARTDFLFSRPVAWWTVWLGRAGAYALVTAVSLACLALPAYVLFGIHSPWLTGPPLVLGAGPFLVLGGIATAGYASARARRPLVTAVLGLTLLFGSALLYLMARASAFGLLPADSATLSWLLALGAVPVLVFSAVYLAVGRGEPVRAAVAAGVAAIVAFLPVVVLAGVINLGWL